ncbi:MAG: hypothetical protein MZV70_20360 [Desulfobacterales bacterium]|nr:hypothetical protein [Desulfobacterales bacterium]
MFVHGDLLLSARRAGRAARRRQPGRRRLPAHLTYGRKGSAPHLRLKKPIPALTPRPRFMRVCPRCTRLLQQRERAAGRRCPAAPVRGRESRT